MSDAASHSAGWRPASYYPDPAIHALDPRFEKYWLKLSAVERLTPPRLDFLSSMYWPIVVIMCVCFLATLYHVSVPVRTSWHYNLPGAALTMTIWIFGSYLLRWVLTNTALKDLMVPVTFPSGNSFAHGLVFDSRVYTPLSDVSPVLASDSAASGMQHMAVVRDYLLPN